MHCIIPHQIHVFAGKMAHEKHSNYKKVMSHAQGSGGKSSISMCDQVNLTNKGELAMCVGLDKMT